MRNFLIASLLCMSVSVFFDVYATDKDVSSSSENGLTIAAKRVMPEPVEPLIISGVSIAALHWGRERGLPQNGGYIVATDENTGEELWTLKVYNVEYQPDLEEDVQDVFITSLSKIWFQRKVKITDELGRVFIVDVESRTATQKK